MEPSPGQRLPGAVLFACTLNRVRSPMAEGLMKRLFGTRVFVDSCGLRPDGDGTADPFVVSVMDELGVDLSDHTPKSFDELEDTSFDLVISLSPEAQHRAVELSRGRAVDIEYWPTLDPTLVVGSRDQMLAAYREVRDSLEARLLERFRSGADVWRLRVFQQPSKPRPERLDVGHVTLPDRLDPPSCRLQRHSRPLIPIPVARDLANPIFSVRLRDPRPARTVVAMPEAAVDEDGETPARQNDVRLARQVGAVEAVAAPQRPHQAADGEFGLGRRTLHPAHHRRAFLRRVDVGQRPSNRAVDR